MILAQGESKSSFCNTQGSGKSYEKLDQGKEIVLIFYDVLDKECLTERERERNDNKLSSKIKLLYF